MKNIFIAAIILMLHGCVLVDDNWGYDIKYPNCSHSMLQYNLQYLLRCFQTYNNSCLPFYSPNLVIKTPNNSVNVVLRTGR